MDCRPNCARLSETGSLASMRNFNPRLVAASRYCDVDKFCVEHRNQGSGYAIGDLLRAKVGPESWQRRERHQVANAVPQFPWIGEFLNPGHLPCVHSVRNQASL